MLICPKHGIFEQKTNSHLQGSGCKLCKESEGEKRIETILNNCNIIFERQKRFDDCEFKQKLPFDFFIEKLNTCIEYDGRYQDRPLVHVLGQVL